MNHQETELVFGAVDGLDLQAVWYQPEVDAAPLVIDIHGGAWSAGHRKSDRYLCRKLVAAGIGVLAIDFRYGPQYQHPAANDDIAQAVRFVRNDLVTGFTVTGLGLLGCSSGGHLALLSGLQPSADCEVDFVIGLWPVSNPLARFQYVQARLQEDPDTHHNFHPARLAEGHLGYFESEACMQAASIQRVLSEGDYTARPRVMIGQPELDQNVPVFMTQTLVGALVAAQIPVNYRLYPGVEHSFALADGPQTGPCIDDVIAFIQAG